MKRALIYLSIGLISFCLGWFFNETWRFAEAMKNDMALDTLKFNKFPIFTNKITIINDSTQSKYIADSFTSFWVPTQNQLDTIDSIIEQAIRENGKDYYKYLKPDSVKQYYRQYICYTDTKGDSIAFINAFLKIDFLPLPGDVRKRDDWRYNLIKVFDGGDRYWQIWINFSKKRYYNFHVNGEA